MSISRKAVSSIQLAKEIGITQKSAWSMLGRLREPCKTGGRLSGTIEMDDSYFGSKEKNKHAKDRLRVGRGPVSKTDVLGTRSRDAEIRATVIEEANGETIRKAVSPSFPPKSLSGLHTFADMFCGIGGFHQAATSLGMKCVFACDIDEECHKAYEHNYGLKPYGDISRLRAENVPGHDLFCAGFPCQPFSIIGKRQGFSDVRGTLFFEIARILKAKRPRAVVLENVRQLASNDSGRTLTTILETLDSIGYRNPQWRLLNALDFGLPQRRERILIVGVLGGMQSPFLWPNAIAKHKPLSDILESNPEPRYRVSERIRRRRHAVHTSEYKPAIWHENKGGNISSYPYSCALRAGASYNYLLVDGERRLTPREMLRLQGFPDSFEIICNDSQTRKQAGNAVPVPMVTAVVRSVLDVCQSTQITRECSAAERAVSAW